MNPIFRRKSGPSIFPIVLALSITMVSTTVKAQGRNLTSFNNDSTSSESKKRESTASRTTPFSRLVALLLKVGDADRVPESLAPTFGLTNSMPARGREIIISQEDERKEKRECWVVYEQIEDRKRPVCVLLKRRIESTRNFTTQYFRTSPAGVLEKAVTLESARDESGKPIPGSGSNQEQNIGSSVTKKGFQTEMSYWLNNWLKKQEKAAAKE